MNKTKRVGIFIGIAVVILAAASASMQARSGSTSKSETQRLPVSSPATSSTAPAPTPTPPQPASQSYTLAQVALHGSSSDCWTAINGNVYNLTDWISQHPGGEGAILSICGKDGSDAFDNQHGGQGRPERILESYIIGTLAQ